MLDYSALLYDPVYGEIGVPAMLAAGAGEVAITVIDDTRPKSNLSGSAEVRSVGPGAFARIPELAANGIERDVYLNAVLTFSGRTWTVRSYELRGSPNGEDLGEVRFLLKVVADVGVVSVGVIDEDESGASDAMDAIVAVAGDPGFLLDGEGGNVLTDEDTNPFVAA